MLRRIPWLCLVTTLAMSVSLLTACGNTAETPLSTDPTSTNPTTRAPITTAPATTTATPTAQDPAEVKLPAAGEPWDVLFFGFDDVFTRLTGELYADQLSDALGTEVRLFEPPGFDHVWAATLVEQLRGNRYPPLGDNVPPAEVIVLLSRPGESPDGGDEQIVEDFERCWWRAAAGVPPTSDLTDEYWSVYQGLLRELYDELWTLRQGQPTVILTLDLYNPSLQQQRESGIDEACVAWFEAWRTQIANAADDNGAVFLSLQDVFNGPDHRLDPTEGNLIGSTDADPGAPWYRSTPEGASLLADALVAASLQALDGP